MKSADNLFDKHRPTTADIFGREDFDRGDNGRA